MSTNKQAFKFSFSEFDPKYLDSLAHEFCRYDNDKDGRLDRTEFVNWLVSGGTNEKTAKNLFYVADVNNDGSLSFDEFKNYAQLQQNMILKGDVDAYVRNIYASIKARSADHEGLNKKEFVKFMKLMNTPLKFYERSKIFRLYDTDGSGTVELDELMTQIEFRNSTLLSTED